MTTVTMSLYVSERFRGIDLKKLFDQLRKDVADDLGFFGFSNLNVEVKDTGLPTSGRCSQVLLEGLSGLTTKKLEILFNSIKAVFGSCLPDVEDKDVLITFDGKTMSD